MNIELVARFRPVNNYIQPNNKAIIAVDAKVILGMTKEVDDVLGTFLGVAVGVFDAGV